MSVTWNKLNVIGFENLNTHMCTYVRVCTLPWEYKNDNQVNLIFSCDVDFVQHSDFAQHIFYREISSLKADRRILFTICHVNNPFPKCNKTSAYNWKLWKILQHRRYLKIERTPYHRDSEIYYIFRVFDILERSERSYKRA